MNRLLQFCKNKKNRRSSGFTLIEMIVAFSILGVAIIAIGGLLITGIRSYNSVGAETNVQNEAQIAMTHVQNTIIDASLGVSYNVQVSGTDHFVENDSAAELNGLSPTNKYIYVFNWNNDRSSVEALILKYDITAKKLYYFEKSGLAKTGAAGTTKSIAEAVDVAHITGWEVLAEGVTDFSIDMSNYRTNRQISVNLTLEKNTKSYSTSIIITLRNDVLINPNTMSDVYDRVDTLVNTVITGVDLTVSSYSMVKGGTVQLSTKVLGSGYPSQRIYQWKIESVTGVAVSKDSDGKISITGDAGTFVEIFNSLSESNSGGASVELSTKVLSLDLNSGYDLLKVTAIAYAGEDEHNQPIYVSDSEYIAVKDISNFSIQPDTESKNKYQAANASLEIQGNSFLAASYADGKGTTVPSSSDTNLVNSVDVMNGNIIDFIAIVSGTNLDDSDKGVKWSLYSTSEAGNVSISSSGVLTVSNYAQQGWAIITACPDLNMNMKLYYMIRIGNEYATQENVLSIGGDNSINRGGQTQLSLQLNGHDYGTLSDFNWSYKIFDSSNRQITDANTSISAGGLLTAGESLSLDYNLKIEVTASMKSKPEIKATRTIAVPRVTLTMTQPTLIAKRGTVIPEDSTTCIVTGLENYSLNWTIASQTNPSYYATLLPNGTVINAAGDKNKTCSINISGKEPSDLTYMRAKATLADYSNYYAECYLSFKEVSLSVAVDKTTLNRGDSATLTASVIPADAGFSANDTTWKIVGAKKGTAALPDSELAELSLSTEKGASTSLMVSDQFALYNTSIVVTVSAVLSGIEKTQTISINPQVDFNVTEELNANRGDTVKIYRSAGTEVDWTIEGVSDGIKSQLSLTRDYDGNAKLSIPVYFAPDNKADTIIYVKATLKGTSVSATCAVKLNQVTAPVIAVNYVERRNNPDYYTFSASNISGINGSYNIRWALSSTDNLNATTTSAGNVSLQSASGMTVNSQGIYGSVPSTFYVIAYVYVKNGYQEVKIQNTTVSKSVSGAGGNTGTDSLKSYNQIVGLSYREGVDLECFVGKDKDNNKKTMYWYCVSGFVAEDESSDYRYFKLWVWERTKASANYSQKPGTGTIYVAYNTTTQKYFYIKEGSGNNTWTEITDNTSAYNVFSINVNPKAKQITQEIYKQYTNAKNNGYQINKYKSYLN